jgi:hypothetical protein
MILAGTLGCQIGTMSFTYLGLPLGTTKPVIQDFMTILSRIEKRSMGINTHFICWSILFEQLCTLGSPNLLHVSPILVEIID